MRSSSKRIAAILFGCAFAGAPLVVLQAQEPQKPQSGAAPSATSPVATAAASAAAKASAAAPKKYHPPKSKKPALPVTLTVEATSPDPPWIMRIENTGTVPIRIPADSRLLRFEMKPSAIPGDPKYKNLSARACKPPSALVPSKFPERRELYLRPGEVYEEQIDPRLYCFGESSTDLLRPGTVMVPHFGFGNEPTWGEAKEPYMAQSTDDVDPYRPLKAIVGAPFTLPEVPDPPPAVPGQSQPSPVAKALPRGGELPSEGEPTPVASTSALPQSSLNLAHGAPPPQEDDEPYKVDKPAPLVDKAAGHIDIYVSRFVDAPTTSDVVLTIRAVNEGRRKLAAVLRGRMLHFAVEELGPDNRTVRQTDCVHQNNAHGIATEMVSEVAPGKEIKIALMISEICPRGTFTKPGLYRITPTLDTSQMGESLRSDPWLGITFAKQSSLVRLAKAPGDFHYAMPRTGPVHMPPGVMLMATDGTTTETDKPARPLVQ